MSAWTLGAAARPAVICLHSSGSSSRQWEALAGHLGERYRVVAVDLRGHGKVMPWGENEPPSLAAESAELAPLAGALAGGVHIVGHSYGGAVAVKLALRLGPRVRSLTLYEPVMFRLALDANPADPGTLEAVRVAAAIRRGLDANEPLGAARVFYEYWSGADTWMRVDEAQRAVLARRMPAVMACFEALFADRTTPEDLATIEAPVLLMQGGRSPASGRAATHALAAAIPQARLLEFPALGHMGPVARPDAVNAAIDDFLGLNAGAVRARGSRSPRPGLQLRTA